MDFIDKKYRPRRNRRKDADKILGFVERGCRGYLKIRAEFVRGDLSERRFAESRRPD